MLPKWQEKENKVRHILEKERGESFEQRVVPLVGADRGYKFDLVSSDGTIVGEVKTAEYKGGNKSTAVARLSDACLLLLGAKGAKKKMLILTDKRLFELFREERQGRIAAKNGIEIRLVKV